MNYSVVYTSKTGNTRKVAKAIFDNLPGENKEIQELSNYTDPEQSETWFVGFWINRGTSSIEMANFLSKLHGKNVALFATCGMGASKAYYSRLEAQMRALLPEDNICLGCYLCQGKMPIQVRKRYEAEQAEHPEDARYSMMIRNFDEAMLHPDAHDLEAAAAFARKTLERYALC